jgi:hypothetical protein
MEYFAALPPERLAAELQARIDAYYQWVLTSGRLARWRIAYDTYYGQRGSHNSSYITPGGKQGELSFLMSNEYRNLTQHLLVMAFQSKRSFETVSVNTDSKAKAQSYVGKGINEYYRRDGRIAANEREATEIALIMDAGWVFNEWNVMKGPAVTADPEDGKPVRQGNIDSRARTPLDVVIDFTRPQAHDRDWILVKDPVNKFDVAAGRKEQYEEITALSRDYTRDAIFRFGDVLQFESGTISSDIDRWTFFHRRSPALPQGRMFRFMTPKLWDFDGPIPYRRLPGNRICPTEQILSTLGYSNMNDLLGLQDVMDAMISSAVTNMTSVGANNIWAENADNFDFEQLAPGMNLLTGTSKPEALILNRLSPEWAMLANFIIQRMEAISGVNAVARGNTEGKDFSGAAMALLQSMSISFNNGLMSAVSGLATDNSNDVIQLTQDFAAEKALGMIIGQNNRYMMKEYSSEDVDGIQYVYCRERNPLQDTTAGKMQLLEKYQSVPGAITSAAQITEVIETGSLDSSTEPGRNLKLTIDQENEAILRGEEPAVHFCDNHLEHMQGLLRLFASPEDRNDAELIGRVRAHWDAHDAEWQKAMPATLMISNCPPYPSLPPAMPPGGAPGEPPGPPGAPPGPGGPPGGSKPPMAGPTPPGGGPDLPTNPLSGNQWTPDTGGLPEGAVNG